MNILSKETLLLIEKADKLIPVTEGQTDYTLAELIEAAENGLSSTHADAWSSEEELQEYIIEFTAQYENEDNGD